MASTQKQFELPVEVTAGLDILVRSQREIRIRLATAYRHWCEAAPSIDGEVEQLDEDDLASRSRRWQDDIEGETATWQHSPTDPEYLLEAASLTRALDELAAVHQAALSADEILRGVNIGFAHVLTRKRPRAGIRRKGQGIRRRLLLRNRIVPTRIDTMEVRIIPLGMVSAGPSSSHPQRVGAAMFRNFSAGPTPSGSSFIITDIAGDDLMGSIDQQIRDAVADGCFALVWPELSVDAKHKNHIGSELRRLAVAGLESGAGGMQVLVAGSHHVEGQDGWRNMATVFDGTGQYEHQYFKQVPYITPLGCVEDIAPGSELPIFITDDYVIGVAICKDMTKYDRHKQLLAMEVDVILVPSMGGKSTMDAHETTAAVLKGSNDTRVFVVQHFDVPPAEPTHLGVVLPAPDEPNGSRVVQSEVYVHYEGTFR